jgi:predicted 3-demethylubiquinone-9 3-methyltransferase (glyoxalase superfamily)
MATIHPFLWFDTQAEAAQDFYLSVFKNAKALEAMTFNEWVSGKDKKVPLGVFDFELEGLRFTALNAGPRPAFNERLSLYIQTKDQVETDYYWEALTADGGAEKPCGWLTDKFGVYWQVVPEIMPRLMADPDHEKADRVRHAMYKMHKLIIADLEAAYVGHA